MVSESPYRHVKIIATLGPASSSEETIQALVSAGVDVFRINMSHASRDQVLHWLQVFARIRQEKKDTRIAVLVDLQGPKIRVGPIPSGEVSLREGEMVCLVPVEEARSVPPVPEELSSMPVIPITYSNLLQDVAPGDRVLFDDGKLEVRIVQRDFRRNLLLAQVKTGGILIPRKGVNFPDSHLSVPALTDKDLRDLQWLCTEPEVRESIHWIALSFVRHPADIQMLRDILARYQKEKPPYEQLRIIAKIEKPQAVEVLDAIIEESDGVMIARGDLGVELPVERLPILQKDIIARCIRKAKPVIVATQIFEHMIEHPYPTRAEVNDVANIIYDGADALMLSNETSVGKYPVRVVETMDRIIRWVEQHADIYLPRVGLNRWGSQPDSRSPTFRSDVVCFQACKMAVELNAKAIISMTTTGYTAFQIASYRPRAPIYIFTQNRFLLDALNLVWGVRAYYYDRYESTDRTIEDVIAILKEEGRIAPGDVVINTASMPIHVRGRTNTVKVSVVD